MLHALTGLERGTQLGLQRFGSLEHGSVTATVHEEVVPLQFGEGNSVTAIAKVRRQVAASNAGANRRRRETGEFRRLSYVNRWVLRDCHAPP
jgi:hypothetical protein